MNLILDILRRIRKRPALYLGEQSLKQLYMFLYGYQTCILDLKILQENDFCILPGFRDFVERKYLVEMSKNWAEIIRYHSSNDEDAFEHFYKLLDEYMESIGQSWPKDE